MSAIVVVERDVAAAMPAAFAHFIDFTRWSAWMPPTFSPHTGPQRALQAGDKFKVKVGRLPIALDVIRFRPNIEICWRGGSRLIMQGEHSYTFSAMAGGTRIRSQETLTGLLTVGPWASRLERATVEETTMILGRFADYIARQTPSASANPAA